MRIAFLFLMMLAYPHLAFSDGERFGPDVPMDPAKEWQRRSGDLKVWLALVEDPHSLGKEWFGTSPYHIPPVYMVSRTRRREKFSTAVFFSGCAKENMPCAATLDFSVVRPDGSIFKESKGNKILIDNVPSPRQALLSDLFITVELGASAPPGTYSVIAVFKVDGENQPSVSVRRQIEVSR
ncbi:MAG: hypothetical protein ABI771_17395 [Betaproteobacteria bacterium]